MTVLSVVQDVCKVVGVVEPSSIFSGITGNRTMQEMVALATEMAQRIAYDLREWSTQKTSATLVGDDATTAFNLPANYKRMLLNTNVWRSTSTQQPMRFFPDFDQWQQRRAAAEADAWGEWTLYGGQIHIVPVMPVGTTARFAYLDKNCVVLNSGGVGDRFTNDADSFRLDERLLKLGMIWQWKAHKGSPYAEDMGTYSDALAVAMGADNPAPIIIDRKPISWHARVSSSWPANWGPQP